MQMPIRAPLVSPLLLKKMVHKDMPVPMAPPLAVPMEFSGASSAQRSTSRSRLSTSGAGIRDGVEGRGATARAVGVERFEFIADKDSRKKSQSKQIRQVKMDLARLLLTTGAHSALIVIPDSLKVHKFATAGDFNTFLQVYATAISEQKKKKRYEVKFRIDDLWERFQGQGGLYKIESLCSALHEVGCDEVAVEDFKDAYLASLVDSQEESRRVLATNMNTAILEFTRRFKSE